MSAARGYAPPSWLTRLLPAPIYTLRNCLWQGSGELEVHLIAEGNRLRFPFRIRLRPRDSNVDVVFGGPEPPPRTPKSLLAGDIRRRVADCHADCLYDFFDNIAASERRGSDDPVWVSLRLIEAGNTAEAVAAAAAGVANPDAPLHEVALGLLLAIATGHRRRRAELWWQLITDDRLDGRVAAALAHAGDGDATALRQAAHSVLTWGIPTARTTPAYGFPRSSHHLSPEVFAPYAADLADRVRTFVEEGYIVLRGLLERELLAAWARRVVRHYRHSGAGSEPLASALDPDQPNLQNEGTLQWSTGMAPIHLVCPELAATVDALAGGQEHLQPLLSDHLHASCILSAREASGPAWHLDESRADGRIDNQHLALLGLILLTDVAEEEGPTAFLPDSPRLVLQSLARCGTEQDQDNRRWTQCIAARCERQVLATGRAGDVYLVHPMTLHRRASVRGKSFRIVANPNFMRTRPLDYLQPRSPVEIYAARGLRL